MMEKPSIIIVEDDPALSGNLKDILEDLGYEVRCFAAGEVACDAASERPPDLALLDLKLPDVDGMDLLARLRGVSADMEIVVMTGHGSVESASQAIDGNVFAYLTKPVDVRALCGTVKNALDHRSTALALRESEERYRNLYETMAQGIVYRDAEGRVVSVNPAAERILGLTKEYMLGQSPNDPRQPCIHEDGTDWPQETRPSAAALRTGKAVLGQVIGVMNPVEGRHRWLTMHAIPQFLPGSDELTGVCMTFEDITERKQAEEALREANEMLQAVVEQSPIAIHVLDRDGNILLWNPAAERIFGWSAEEVIGKRAPFVTPDKESEFQDNLRRSLGGEAVTAVKTKRVRKNGEEVILDVSIAPIRDVGGGVVGSIGLMADVTEQKHLEAQAQHSQRMEAVGRLSSGVAHEFKNLLMGISGYTELLQIKLGSDHPDFSLTTDLLACVDKSAKLVSQLQAFSKKKPAEPCPTDLNKLVWDSEHLLARLLKEHINLQLDLCEAVQPIMADPGQIEQALVNLVLNARDAMPHGGRVTIATRSLRLDKSALLVYPDAKPGEYTELSVSDTGIGMDEATKERIFEPFFTTKQDSERTGLGLAVVYAIVRQHGGTIDVTSKVGRGATFRICLPTSDAASSEEQPVHTAGVVRGAGTILLAEDEETVREPAKSVLEGCGYTVLCAQDGEEAVDIFRQQPAVVDMVILDVVMPKMGGKHAWQAMQAVRPDLNVLFMSGHSPASASQDYAPPPDMPLLAKPFPLQRLAEKVAELLECSTNGET